MSFLRSISLRSGALALLTIGACIAAVILISLHGDATRCRSDNEFRLVLRNIINDGRKIKPDQPLSPRLKKQIDDYYAKQLGRLKDRPCPGFPF